MLEARPGQLYLSRVRKGCDASCWVARYTLADIYGQSPALVQARELARRGAQAECAVLLLGGGGTGKELFAQAIHRARPRPAGPLVPSDLAAHPPGLLVGGPFGCSAGGFSGGGQEG